jgi:hypothetical protein
MLNANSTATTTKPRNPIADPRPSCPFPLPSHSTVSKRPIPRTDTCRFPSGNLLVRPAARRPGATTEVVLGAAEPVGGDTPRDANGNASGERERDITTSRLETTVAGSCVRIFSTTIKSSPSGLRAAARRPSSAATTIPVTGAMSLLSVASKPSPPAPPWSSRTVQQCPHQCTSVPRRRRRPWRQHRLRRLARLRRPSMGDSGLPTMIAPGVVPEGRQQPGQRQRARAPRRQPQQGQQPETINETSDEGPTATPARTTTEITPQTAHRLAGPTGDQRWTRSTARHQPC